MKLRHSEHFSLLFKLCCTVSVPFLLQIYWNDFLLQKNACSMRERLMIFRWLLLDCCKPHTVGDHHTSDEDAAFDGENGNL